MRPDTGLLIADLEHDGPYLDHVRRFMAGRYCERCDGIQVDTHQCPAPPHRGSRPGPGPAGRPILPHRAGAG